MLKQITNYTNVIPNTTKTAIVNMELQSCRWAPEKKTGRPKEPRVQVAIHEPLISAIIHTAIELPLFSMQSRLKDW